MKKENLDKLEEIKNLREIWPNEATDFTPWLADEDNIELLSEAIGIDIVVEETESAVGIYSTDILAHEENSNRKIIIENQLENTNHDHLGKIITYAAGKSADILIWIVKKATDEHKAAIEWLNNHTDEEIGFFLCEIKLYKIGNSKPAVKFEVIESPNNWTKKEKTQITKSQQIRYDYWVKFNDYAFKDSARALEYSKSFNQRKPSFDHWMSLSIGSSDCHISILQIRKKNSLAVELYISEDKNLFKEFYKHKEKIETELSFKLEWKELPNKKASRILVEKKVDFDDFSKFTEQFDWIMDTTLKIKKVFRKYFNREN